MFNTNVKSTAVRNNRKGMIRLHIVPIIVWLSCLACVVVLFNTRIQQFEVLGMAHSKTWQVSAVETARIKSMTVNLFDKVKKGQIIAVLESEDSKLIEARLNTITAEIARLRAEFNANREILDAEAKNSQIDMVTEHRRFSVDVENAWLAIFELKTIIEPDLILLENHQIEINIEKELNPSGQFSTKLNIEKAQTIYDSLATKIAKNEEFLAQAKINRDQAIKRRDEFFSTKLVNPSHDIALTALIKAIDVQMRLIEEIRIEGKALVKALIIESPADGIVSHIMTKAGEVAIAQLPILIIAEDNPTEIIGYASDHTHNVIKVGQKVELVKNGSTPQIAESQIIQIGPALDLVPPRLMANPDRPQWGRPFIVKIPPGMKLAPGEKVGIRGLHK